MRSSSAGFERDKHSFMCVFSCEFCAIFREKHKYWVILLTGSSMGLFRPNLDFVKQTASFFFEIKNVRKYKQGDIKFSN